MKNKSKSFENIYKKSRSELLYIPFVTAFLVWGFLLIAYPEIAAEGVSLGIKLCAESIVPSLFPFLLFSSLLSGSGVLNSLTKKVEKFSWLFFALPGNSVPIIIMSLVGGFPIGAFLIKKAVDDCKLTPSQGRRMLLFCVNAGPAFTISTVGSMMLGSKKAGIIIYASTTAASLVIGVLTRFISSEAPESGTTEKKKNTTENGLYDIITESVNSSSQAILNICIWIIVFSCLNKSVECLPLNDSFVLFFKSFSEVTNGVITLLQRYPLALVSGLISFGGICVHLQLMPCISALKMKYKYFITARIVSSSISIAAAYVLFEIFPVSISTASLGNKPHTVLIGSSLPVCACMLIMSGLLIIGDNYICARKTHN